MTDSNQALHATTTKPFAITLKSRAMSGFEWKPRFNSAAIRLLRRRHLSKPRSFGASGSDEFEFQALQPGKFVVQFELVRPFEDNVVDEKSYVLYVE